MAEPPGMPIGFVSRKTGLSAHVIRAWERRYRAIDPGRTQGGHRLYTQADIDRLLRLKRLINDGHRISHIAGLDDDGLRSLDGPSPRPAALPARGDTDALLDAGMDAVARLDRSALEQTLLKAAGEHARQQLLEDVIAPLMERVGRCWAEGSLRIVHGHMAATVLHAHLLAMLDHPAAVAAGAPRLLIAAPAGQHCVLGALAVAVTARDHGWDPVVLGADLPVEEIAAAGDMLNPEMIALSLTCRLEADFMIRELRRLAGLLSERCPMVIGGRALRRDNRLATASGGDGCNSLSELALRLQ